MAETALDEVNGSGVETAEGRRVHQLRDQQHGQMLGELPEQYPAQGGDQEAFILQHGDNLMAVIEQVGQGNYAEIRQTGSDNQASISQYGAYNDARIEQTGQGLRSAVTQYGVGQQINIVQGR